MRKAVLLIVFIASMTFELFLCSAFLPIRYQVALQNRLSQLLPQQYDHSKITHPDLEGEIEHVLQENTAVRLALYTFITTLLAANSLLVFKTWKAVKSGSASRVATRG